MPIFEYRCKTCGKHFEKLSRYDNADRGVDCPDCESEDVVRLLSTFATGAGGASRHIGGGCAPSPGGGFR